MRYVLLNAAVAVIFSVPAFAQQGDDGIRVGAFIFQPSVAVATGFDSNIFIETTGEDSSVITTVAPRLNVISDWNRHELAFTAGGAYRLVWDSTDDNAFSADVGLSAVLDVTRAVGISTDIGYAFVSEARGEDDTGLGISEPVTSHNVNSDLGVDMVFGRFRVSPFGGVTYRDFQDATLIGGGVDNQDDRDRVEYGAGLELGYGLRRGIETFVRGEYNKVNFQEAVDDTGINRDSDGWRVLAGVNVELTRLIEASVGLGVEGRSFEDPTLDDVTDFSAQASVGWFITPLTTINFDAARTFQETTLAGSSVANETSLQLGVSHDLLRNLTLGGQLTYTRRDFEGITRNDNLFGAGVNADWQVMRLLSVAPSYQFLLGDSNTAGEDFVDHQFFVTATYGFR